MALESGGRVAVVPGPIFRAAPWIRDLGDVSFRGG